MVTLTGGKASTLALKGVASVAKGVANFFQCCTSKKTNISAPYGLNSQPGVACRKHI